MISKIKKVKKMWHVGIYNSLYDIIVAQFLVSCHITAIYINTQISEKNKSFISFL